MSLENTNIAVVEKNTIIKAEALHSAKAGSAVKIKAVEGGKYILAEGEHGLAPENITVQRAGKDLHVMLEGTDANSPQLIIEDYFDKPGELVGKGEDGQWHQFISTDGDSQHDAALLTDGESAPLALGANTVASLDGLAVAEGAIPPALIALGALAALAAAAGLAYLIGHRNNGDHGTSAAGTPGAGDDSGVLTPIVSAITDNTGELKGSLTTGQSTDETLPVFSGTGKPGTTIELRENGLVIGSGTVGIDGNWSVKPAVPLAEGSHNFDVVAKDSAGNVSQPTTPVIIIVDLTPPDAATDLLLTDNVGTETGAILADGITDDTTPTYSGKAEPNAVVFIRDNGVEIGSALVSPAGIWNFTPREPLSAGEHSFSTVVQDAAGNRSLPSPPLAFVVDPNGLSATIDYVIDDTNAAPAQLISGSLTKDNTPTLSGHGTVRSVVYIYEENSTTPIGSARVLGNGTWSFTTPVLPDGHHAFVAIPRDATGTPGNQSAPFDLDIDTVAPTRPGLNNDGIESVWDDVGLIQGPIANGGSTDDTTPTLKGSHLTPYDIVYVYDGADPLGSVTVDINGGWSLTPSPALNPGRHSFTIVVSDPAGNRSEASDPWVVIIDTTPPAVPQITEVTDDVGSVTGAIAAGGVTDDAWPTVHGTAEGHSLVVIYDRLNNGTRVPLGSTFADADGNWEFTPKEQLSNGHHSLSAVALDEVRNTSAESARFDFDLVTGGVPSAPAITNALDDVGAITGMLQSGDITDDAQPRLNGTAPANSLVTIYVDQIAVDTVSVGENGRWNWTPGVALPEGVHNFSATATDDSGNVSQPTSSFKLIIDTTAPDAADNLHLSDNVGPVQGEIINGSTTDDSTPTFSGHAEPGSTVIVRDNGSDIGTARVLHDGSWSFTPKTPLADGHHEFSAVVQDPAGNRSPATPPVGFEVDTSAVFISVDYALDDVGPITQNLRSGDATDDATPTLVGKAKPNAIVTLFDGTTPLGSVQANAEGVWKITTPALTEGVHHLTATATDASGTSATSNAFDLTIDLTPPGVGSGISDVWDNVGPVQGLVPSQGATDDTTPTLRGSGLQEGDIVTVRDGEFDLGTAKVGPDGNWTFTPVSALPDGTHDFTIIVTDPVGNSSLPSDPYTVIIDTDAPTKPVISEVIDDQGSLTGKIAEGGVTDDSRPTITGTAQPHSLVTVYDNNQPIGSVTADEDGNWMLTPVMPLPYGSHSLHATSSDAVGNISEPSDPFGFDLITGGIPSAPSIIGAVDDVGSITGMLQNNDSTDDARPKLVGNAPSGSLVTITVDGVQLDSVTADFKGQWNWTPPADLTEGEHSFSVVATDRAGNVSAPTGEFKLIVDLTAPQPAVGELTDDVGAVTGIIADGSITDDSTPTYSGNAEPGSIVIIRDGDLELGSCEVDIHGNWSFTPKVPLADGPHQFSTVVQDPAGNLSAPGETIHFVVDTSAVVVTIDYAMDDAGNITGNLATGSVTDDSTPTLVGKATANAVVHIFDGDHELGSVTASPFGDWNYTVTPAVAEGLHHFSASVTNGAGNTTTTAAFDLNIDLSAPTIPGNDGIGDVQDDVGTITGSVPDGGTTDDSTPTLVGSGLQPGDTVTIRDGGLPIGTATVVKDGSWSFTPNPPLDEGSHDFTIIVTDPAGNESEPSDPWTIVVDVTAPAQPEITSVFDDQGDVTGALTRGDVTDDTMPVISGTAERNSLVTVYDNGVPIGSARVGTDGTWMMTPEKPLTGASHNLTAKATDIVGNISQPSDGFNFSLVEGSDAAAQTPVITGGFDDVEPKTGDLASGDATNDQRPLLKGTGHAGDVIELFDGTHSLGSTKVDFNGNWEMEPNADLAEGAHRLTVVATNAAGNLSSPSNAFDLDVDLTAPTQPGADEDGIRTIIDDVGPIVGDIANGGVTDDTKPKLVGDFQDEGNIIYIYDNGVPLGSTTAGPNGDWSYTPTADLGEGQHSFTIKVEDRAGWQSEMSDPYVIVIDITAPEKPLITSVIDDQGAQTGALTPGEVTDDAQPQINGTAEANSLVFIYDGTGVQPIGSARVSPEGIWNFTPTRPLQSGDHSISVVAQDAAGLRSPASDAFDFSVLTGGVPSAVAITSVWDDAGTVTGNIASNGFTDDTTPTVTGTAPAYTLVTVTFTGPGGTTVVASVTSDMFGNWSVTSGTLGEGRYSIVAAALDPANNPIQSGSWIINVDTTAPATPVITTVMDDVAGGIVGNLPNGSVTNDNRPTLVGTAEAGSVVRIFDGNTELGSVTATGGNWSYTTPVLATGAHSLTATATDAAGNVSAATAARTLTVDTTAPSVAISTVMDDVAGGIVGNLPNGSVTNDSQPTLNGTAEAGSLVRIFDGGRPLGSVTAVNGTWNFTTGVLATGAHSLTATATDAAGNTSAATAARTFTVDTTAPAVPVVSSVMDDVAGGIVGNLPNGSVTNDNRPTLNGTAEAGSVVRIFDGNTELGSVTATGGTWVYTTPVLASGAHSLTATATDAAGNVSAATTARTFTVDITAPTAPVVDSIIDNVGTTTGNIANGGSTDDTTPTLSGHAEANAVVRITVDGTVYSTTASTTGIWTFTPPALALGAHSFGITATDAAGNTSATTTRSLTVVSPVPDGAKGVEDFEYATGQYAPIISGARLASGLVISCSWSGYAIMTVAGQGHHAQLYTSATHATRLTWGNGVHTTDVHFDLVAPTAAAPMRPTVVTVYSSTGTVLTTQTITSPGRFNFEAPAGQSIASVDMYVAGATDAAPAMIGFDNVSWGEKASGVIALAAIMGDEVSDQPVGLEQISNAHEAQTVVDTAGHDSAAAQGSEQAVQPVSPVNAEEPSAPSVSQPQTPVSAVQPHAGTTLILTHADQPIDFSAVVAGGETVSKVNMTNAQADTLNITLEDVLTHGEANAFIADGTKQMLIQGEKGDVVNLSDLLPKGAEASDWSKANSAVNVDGVQYEVYQHGSSDAELLVQMGIQINLTNH